MSYFVFCYQDQKQLWEQRVYLILQFTVRHDGNAHTGGGGMGAGGRGQGGVAGTNTGEGEGEVGKV